jgi:hypothetical membrane protein
MWSAPWWAVLSSGAAPVVLVTGTTVAANLQPDGYDPMRQTLSTLASDGATDRWVMTMVVLGLGLAHFVTAVGLRTAAMPGRAMLAIGGSVTALVAGFPQPDGHGTPSHALVTGAAFGALALWPALASRRRWPRGSVLTSRRRWPRSQPAPGDATVGGPTAGGVPVGGPTRRDRAAGSLRQDRAVAGSAREDLAGRTREDQAAIGPARLAAAHAEPACPWPLLPAVGTVATIISLSLIGWFLVELTMGTRPGLAEITAIGALTLWPLAAVLGVRRARTG